MPTYDYVCDKCGHEFELFQKMSDRPKRRCPRCRAALRRRIGAGSGLLFKGSGFYATDYRSPGYQVKAKSEKGGSETSAGSKSEDQAKPATGGKPARGDSRKTGAKES